MKLGRAIFFLSYIKLSLEKYTTWSFRTEMFTDLVRVIATVGFFIKHFWCKLLPYVLI